MENGPGREDGTALLSGDVVSIVPTSLTHVQLDNFIYLVLGWYALPTAFERQSLSNAFPFFLDCYRRAAAGLAAHRLPRFDTRQILEMPRG